MTLGTKNIKIQIILGDFRHISAEALVKPDFKLVIDQFYFSIFCVVLVLVCVMRFTVYAGLVRLSRAA